MHINGHNALCTLEALLAYKNATQHEDEFRELSNELKPALLSFQSKTMTFNFQLMGCD
jgi:hypothetical protein